MNAPPTEKAAQHPSATRHSLFPAGQLIPFILVTVLLFLWAIPNNLNNVLIRQFVSMGVVFRGWFGLWCVLLTSFFMSLMFPTIFAMGLKGLGPNTKIGGSLLVMAIVGGAAMTPLMGFISEKFHGIAWAYTLPLFSYIVIALYSFYGSRQAEATI